MEGAQRPQGRNLRKVSDTFKVPCSSEHSHLVFNGLNEQREKDLFCDVVLISDGVRFPAHRNILAASSGYFYSMFTTGMRESYQNEIELIGVSSVGCKAILDYLYGNDVFLDGISIDCILKASHLMQIGKLVDVCCDYIKRKLNADNYIQLREMASAYCLDRLDSSIDCFILRNFGMLCFTPSFLENIPVEKLCLYLDSDQVQPKIEYDLLMAALHWLNFGPNRVEETDRVIENIRFSLIPKIDIINLVMPALGYLTQHMDGQSLIDEALYYHSNVTAQPVLQNRRSTLRSDGEKLLFLGGDVFELHPVDKNVRYFDPKVQTWIPETRLPDWRGDFCVAVLGNYIYCAGGYTVEETTHNISNIVYRYDPRWKQWIKVAPMNHCRQSFYLAALEDRLIAIGGEWTLQHIYGSVEMYNPQTDSWSFVAPLPRSYYKHAGAIYKEHIYISGGESEINWMATKNLLCYDYRADTWEEKTSMSTERCSHSMCTVEEYIYVIGGTDGIRNIAYQSVECYSPLSNQWTKVAPLLRETCHTGVAVWKGDIYVLGGTASLNGTPEKTVQVYDQKKNKWYRGPNLPEYVAGVTACVCVLKPKIDHRKAKEWCI